MDPVAAATEIFVALVAGRSPVPGSSRSVR